MNVVEPLVSTRRTLVDPIELAKILWPKVQFYKEQREIIYSVVYNDETFVPAANMMGKDFVTAFVVLWFFLTRSPCRIVTTSADYNQLETVLWGELRRFIQDSVVELDSKRGGPLLINHLHLRKVDSKGKVDGLSSCIGRVTAKGEGGLGYHVAEVGDGIPRTLWCADEASGLEDIAYERATTWARRILVIGNCYPCNNFFEKGVAAGDVKFKPHVCVPDSV